MKANTIITGGKPNGHTEMNQQADGQPRRCLEESATLLHGGLDTSRQVEQVEAYLTIYFFIDQKNIQVGYGDPAGSVYKRPTGSGFVI
jgi:hypothetical protein